MMSGTNLRKLSITIGIILALWGAWIYAYATYGPSPRFEALNLPVFLAPGTVETPPFSPDLDQQYLISLDFDKRSSIANIECYLGPSAVHSELCERAPKLIEISWKVHGDDGTAAEGDSTGAFPPLFSYPTDTTGRINGQPKSRRVAAIIYSDPLQLLIGSFRASKKRTYRLTLNIRRDATALQPAHPRIVVRIPVGLNEDYGAAIWVKSWEGVILCGVGLLVFVVSCVANLLGRSKRRQLLGT